MNSFVMTFPACQSSFLYCTNRDSNRMENDSNRIENDSNRMGNDSNRMRNDSNRIAMIVIG